jgi:tetratricopeptide (TPR) repeat protein
MLCAVEQDLKPDYDNGEMLLYKNRILEELGDIEATYDHLVASEPLIVDKLSLREKKVELLLKLGRNAEAEVVCKELLSINSENYNYHNTLLLSRGCDVTTTLPDSAQDSLLDLYSKLLEQEPRSNALKRVPLNFLTGDRFKKHFEGYVTPPLRKGVPSLFTDLKPLYKDESKTGLMEEVMLNFHKSLTAEQQLPSVGKAEVPVTLLWVLVYLAQHYDRKGDHIKALEYIDDAIKCVVLSPLHHALLAWVEGLE